MCLWGLFADKIQIKQERAQYNIQTNEVIPFTCIYTCAWYIVNYYTNGPKREQSYCVPWGMFEMFWVERLEVWEETVKAKASSPWQAYVAGSWHLIWDRNPKVWVRGSNSQVAAHHCLSAGGRMSLVRESPWSELHKRKIVQYNGLFSTSLYCVMIFQI